MRDFKWSSGFSEKIFYDRYARDRDETWPMACRRIVDHVCGTSGGLTHALMSKDDRDQLVQYMSAMKFLPGGRYIANAGVKEARYWNNCFCLKAEHDTREEWADLTHRAMMCLMTGGGIGVDYSALRPNGYRLRRTGGVASGPLSLAQGLNDMARHIRQGGNRRAANWAGINWQHEDFDMWLRVKDWDDETKRRKSADWDYPAPMDITNVSILWDTDFAEGYLNDYLEGEDVLPDEWYQSVEYMCRTGEPGHCYNFYQNEMDTLRNACTEFISDRDSDVCNLGSVNLAACSDINEFRDVVALGSRFLVCGTLRAELPYQRVSEVRAEYRKIGLGIMGLHEWLLQRGYPYKFNDELGRWMYEYKNQSEKSASEHAARFYIPAPKAYRAIAPNGTTSILAGTTGGIEPIYAAAYRRTYVDEFNNWKWQFVIDGTAERIIQSTGCDPDGIDTALKLAEDPEPRIEMQARIQDFVDMGISSTINLPAWGTEYNNADTARTLAGVLARYCSGLRGITVYPDGGRGTQPLQQVPYAEAKAQLGVVFDVSENTCKEGVCGV